MVKEKKGNGIISERRYSKVERSFTLPSSIDEQKVDAKLQDGVLHLHLPKEEKQKQRKIEINSS